MHHFARRIYSYMIGHKWPGGGADELARELHAHDPDWFFFWWDARKLDQSIVAILISVICMLSLVVYRPGTRYYDILKNIMAHCSDITAVKYVTWLGKYCRVVIGTVFSGEFNTGHIDTMVMDILWESFIISVKDKVGKIETPEAKEALILLNEVWEEDTITPYVIGRKGQPKNYAVKLYGDDGLAGAHMKLRKWVNLKDFMEFSIKEMGITLKDTASGESVEFFTRILPDGSCETNHPNLLKRYFIKITTGVWQGGKEKCVVGFRPIVDYNVRLGRSTTDLTDPAIEFARIIGLMWDTMGTNKVAWSMMEDAIEWLKTKFPNIEADLLEISGYADSVDPVKIAKYRKFESVLDYSKKIGGDINLITVPNQGAVFYRFLPHDVNSRFVSKQNRKIQSCITLWHERSYKNTPFYYTKMCPDES
jgi:hypothetical protein